MSAEDLRARAYETLAVPNANPPLLPSEVGYLELRSSPDPRVAPTVFALEHARVRVGRFSTVGTYATSSDLYVAVGDEATAISPMNTMFEFIGGAFHAFDTRSVNGTFVNGTQIKRRVPLAPGDVIDIGGAPDDGGARVVFLGTQAPAGRAVRRAPPLTKHHWQSPRNKLAIDIDSTTGIGRAMLTIEADDWRSEALGAAERAGRALSPHLPAMSAELVYTVGEPLQDLPRTWLVDARRARGIVADLCDAAAACHRVQVIVGPFEHGLVWVRPDGRAVLFGAGLARVALLLESVMRGGMMTPRHFRTSPEELAGGVATPATDVFFAAYFLVELITGREPDPSGEAYATAIARAGADLPAGLLSLVTRALAPDPATRPSLAQLAAALRG
jgi:serine/threonine-protein kinase